MSELKLESYDQTKPSSPAQIPACQKCGRQDETLRLVIFPFVFSLVVITFRRSFKGIWCRTHQKQQQLISGLISALFGWIGIPFGVIYTPISILQLAKGGIQPIDANIQILSAIAEDKLNKGDAITAARCLEECLKFRNDDEVKKRLNQIRSRYRVGAEPIGCISLAGAFVRAIFFSVLVGTGIGFLDYLRNFLVHTLVGSNAVSIILIILAWTPFIAAMYLGGLGLASIIEKTLLYIKSKTLGLAISFGIISGLAVMYGIFEGIIIADNIYAILTNQLHSIGEIVVVSLVTLFAGGLFEIAGLLGNTSIIFSIILLLATIFYLWIGIWKSRETVRWQQRIDNTFI